MKTNALSMQIEVQVNVNAQGKRQCYCYGLKSRHRYHGSCKLMSEMGYLFKKDDVDDVHIKLTHCNQ